MADLFSEGLTGLNFLREIIVSCSTLTQKFVLPGLDRENDSA